MVNLDEKFDSCFACYGHDLLKFDCLYLVAVCMWPVHWYNSMEQGPCVAWVTVKHVVELLKLNQGLRMTALFWNHCMNHLSLSRSGTKASITHLPYGTWKRKYVSLVEESLINRRWRISTTPNTTKFFWSFSNLYSNLLWSFWVVSRRKIKIWIRGKKVQFITESCVFKAERPANYPF